MNKRMIVWLLGALLLIESGLMLLPLVTALLYREWTGLYFLYTILGAAAAGGLMMLVTRPKNKTIYARDGLMTVALSWRSRQRIPCVSASTSGADSTAQSRSTS